MAVLGLAASWCGPAVNKPIMTEIVDDRSRASVISWLTALEGSSAACFGAPLVGLLAENVFGYRPTSMVVSEMPETLRMQNAEALSHAMLLCTMIPWALCFCCYSLLHLTFGRDRIKVEEDAASATGSSARPWTALL